MVFGFDSDGVVSVATSVLTFVLEPRLSYLFLVFWEDVGILISLLFLACTLGEVGESKSMVHLIGALIKNILLGPRFQHTYET